MEELDINQLRDSVAELLVVRASGHSFDNQREYPLWELENKDLKRLLKAGVGGVILFGGNTIELAHRCKTLKQWAKKPILLCADVEEGLGQRFLGGSWLIPPMAVAQIYQKDPERALVLAEEYGCCIGVQARKCGLNWVLAPVCDINSNPSNPVINMRAWGEDPRTVSRLVCAFHRGLSSEGVLTCAKHFPGHGDSDVDSHLALPIVQHDTKRLEDYELQPFQAIVEEGVDSVMSAHILLPNIDPIFPATFSSKILTHLLGEKVGFDGLVVTDALVMDAISKTYGDGEAAVLAFQAGADLIMMPKDPDVAISSICQALLDKRIPMERLEIALNNRRKAFEKLNLGTNVNSFREGLLDKFEFVSSRFHDFEQELIHSSVVIRNPDAFSLNQIGTNLIRVDSIFPSSRIKPDIPAILIPSQVGFQSVLLHSLGVSPWQDDPRSPLALDRFKEGLFLLQLFIRGNPFLDGAHNNEPWLDVVQQLQNLDRLAGLIVYGSHYTWCQLSEALDPSLPAAYCPGQTHQAQHLVLSSFVNQSMIGTFTKAKGTSQFTD